MKKPKAAKTMAKKMMDEREHSLLREMGNDVDEVVTNHFELRKFRDVSWILVVFAKDDPDGTNYVTDCHDDKATTKALKSTAEFIEKTQLNLTGEIN